MTGQLDVDRTLDAYLAPDRERVPDRVIEGALLQIETSPQARRGLLAPWRFPPMSILSRAVVGLAIALAVAVGGYTLLSSRPTQGGPTASASTAPSVAPTAVATPRQLGSPLPEPTLGASFTSDVYNDSLKYPGSWKATPAAKAWAGTINAWTDLPVWGNAALDALAGSAVRLSIWGAYVPQSTTLTQRQNAEQWVKGLGIGAPTCEASSQLPSSFMIKAYDAYTLVNGCPSSGGILPDGVTYQVAVVPLSHLWNYGWVFTFDGHVDAPYVRAFLGSISLDGPRSF